MKIKIIYISGSRADYGLMKETLKEINKFFDLKIAVCGMHLLNEHGESFKEIQKDKFNLLKLNAKYENDSVFATPKFLSKLYLELSNTFKKEKPDIILLLGDRSEMLCAATVATYLGIPIAHIHGGDLSSTVDEPVRHAITKLAHIHFPATKKSAFRIMKMGEEKNRIHLVGAPGLDSIIKTKIISKQDLFQKLNLKNDETFLLLYHPVSLEIKESKKQMDIILNTLQKLNKQTIIIYPNSDPGSKGIIQSIKEHQKHNLFKIFKNLEHDEFINLLRYVQIFIGNSSSGIIEASSFKLPVINIGSRQDNRERNNNVIDINCNEKEILKAIKKSLNKNFKKQIKPNPYGKGIAYKKITNILLKINLDSKLINKRMTY